MCAAAAVVTSGVPGADEREVTKVMSAIADRVVHEFVEPFVFPNHHHRILEPYNYYEFGQVCYILGKGCQHVGEAVDCVRISKFLSYLGRLCL